MLKLAKKHVNGYYVLSLFCFVLSCVLMACGAIAEGNKRAAEVEQPAPVEVNVAVVRSPLSMGMASFMESARAGELHNSYAFAVVPEWREIMTALDKGTVDIAVIPVGVIPLLCEEGFQPVSVLDICALGEMYLMTADEDVSDLGDLADRDILMTDMGTMTNAAATYVIESSVDASNVEFEELWSAAQVAATLAAKTKKVGILAEPYASSAMIQNPSLRRVVDLADQWDAIADDGSQLVAGVTVVRNEFAAAHPEAVAEFVAAQTQSTQALLDDPMVEAQHVSDMGIVESTELAEAIVPHAHLVCIDGVEMRETLGAFLARVYASNDAYAAYAVPGEDFYYVPEGAEPADEG